MPPTQRLTLNRMLRTALLIWFLVIAILLASCGNPFSNGDESGSDSTTPIPTEADVPVSTPAETARGTVEGGDGEWSVVTGPERQAPPEHRGNDQTLSMTGPTDPPTTLDPALVRDTTASFLVRQTFRGLVRLDENLEPVPDLAERIEISPDGRTYRFVLHEGLSFHDGTTIDAADVKASLERAADPSLTGGDGAALPARNNLDDVEGALERMNGERDDIPGIRVIDDQTLEIQLVRGVVDFLERMANPSTYIVDVESAEHGTEWWQSPNGSGPFVISDWDPARRILFTPHDGYVSPPSLSEVVIRMGADAVGEMQLYETGEIDLAVVPVSVLDRVDYEGSPLDGELRAEAMLSTTMVMISADHEGFDDQSFRQALLHAFPRERIPEVMLDGRARRAEGVLPTEMDVLAEADFPYDFNPERASELFAGSDVAAIDDVIPIYSAGGGIPGALKHHYEEVFNHPVEVVQLRWADYMMDLENGDLPFFVLSWVADGPDPVSYLRSLFHSESPDNYSRFSDERVDELLDQATVERDNDRRDELLFEAHEIILESAVVMPLYHSVDYLLIASHVHGVQTTPMGILGLEAVWIER